MKLAACVVLYNPDASVVDNIKTYASGVDEVFAVDNSDEPDAPLLDRITALAENVTVIPMHGNQGIAVALNRGLQEASRRGYGYILTMDEDSYFMDD